MTQFKILSIGKLSKKVWEFASGILVLTGMQLQQNEISHLNLSPLEVPRKDESQNSSVLADRNRTKLNKSSSPKKALIVTT